MNLPNCPSPVNGDRTSVNVDGELRSASSSLGESNGGGRESPRTLPAADRSSKVPHVSGGPSASSWRSWLVGKCCWGCEDPVPKWWRVTTSGGSMATKTGRSVGPGRVLESNLLSLSLSLFSRVSLSLSLSLSLTL